jgi:hypothetical protein
LHRFPAWTTSHRRRALSHVRHRNIRCDRALLEAAGAFRWINDPDESVAWMIRFVDAGLTAVRDSP